jgi:hypothetical protein
MPTKDESRRGRGGRPKSVAADVRSTTIGVRVSASEYAALRIRADEMKMTPAQWLRTAALARRLPAMPVPAINREQYAELARLAGNINQLAYLANSNRISFVEGADAELLRSLDKKISELRLTLIGIHNDDSEDG